MAEVRPTWVARWISAEIQRTSFHPLREAIETVLVVHLVGKSPEAIADLGEELEEAVYDFLGVITDEQKEDALDPTFELAGDPKGSHIRALNTDAPKVLPILQAMPSERFEAFCVAVLKAIGGEARRVGGTGDGGVDFVATDAPLGTVPGPAFRRGAPLVVGQAKRYRHDKFVSEAELRDFVGGGLLKLDEVRRENSERFGLLCPAVFAFWTTSQFTESAKDYARRMGIWSLNGLALAQLACKLKLDIS